MSRGERMPLPLAAASQSPLGRPSTWTQAARDVDCSEHSGNDSRWLSEFQQYVCVVPLAYFGPGHTSNTPFFAAFDALHILTCTRESSSTGPAQTCATHIYVERRALSF